MDVTVTFENGQSHVYKGVPDGTSPDVVTAQAQKEFGQQVKALDGGVKSSMLERAGRQVKLAGSAALQGVAGLPALTMEIGGQFAERFPPTQVVSAMANVVRQRFGMPIDISREKFGERLQGVQGGAEELFGVKPEIAGEHYMTEGIKGAAGALTGGGAAVAPVRSAIAGASGGIGGELAARLGGDNALTRVAGALGGAVVGGGLANFLGGVRPQLRKLAEEAYRGLDDAVLKKAEVLQAKALQEGVQLDLAQALDAVGAPSSNVTTIRNILANSKSGVKTQEVLHGQPVQLKNLADQTVLELPGTVRQPGDTANTVAEAATKVIQNAKSARSALWKKTFDDSLAMLKKTAGMKVSEAKQTLTGTEQTLAQARARLQQLHGELAISQRDDAAAVAAQNAKVEEAQALVAKMQAFTLPRGKTVGNRGALLDQPARGESIVHDQITREVGAGQIPIPPKVEAASSLPTAQAQQAVTAQTGVVKQVQSSADRAAAELAAAQKGMTAISAIPQNTHDRAVGLLQRRAAEYPNTPRAVAMNRLAKAMTDDNGLPITDPLKLNEILKSEAHKLKSPDLATQGVDAATVGWISDQIQNVRKTLGKGMEPFRAANATYGPFTETVIDPLKQGPVGQLAGRRGALPDVQASVTKLASLFNRGVDPRASGTSEILTLARELKKTNPDAFPDAAKTHLSRVLGDSFEATHGGVPGTSEQAAARLWTNLFSTPAKVHGMQEMAAGIATSYGLPKPEVVRGLNNLAVIVRALKVRPEQVGGLQAKEVAELAGGNRTSNLARVFGFLPFERAARKIEDAQLARTFGRFDEILTSPKGAKMLIELGKQKPLSPESAAILAGFAGNIPEPAKELAPQ